MSVLISSIVTFSAVLSRCGDNEISISISSEALDVPIDTDFALCSELFVFGAFKCESMDEFNGRGASGELEGFEGESSDFCRVDVVDVVFGERMLFCGLESVLETTSVFTVVIGFGSTFICVECGGIGGVPVDVGWEMSIFVVDSGVVGLWVSSDSRWL